MRKATLLLVLFFFCTMTPYIFNGFYADDALNSQVALVAQQEGLSILGFALKINRGWMDGPGRFYPLSWIVTYHYYGFFHTLPLARILHMLIIGLNISFFSYILYRWTQKKSLIFLFIPILLSLFQMREPFDPISGYIPLMQSILFGILGTLYFQWAYFKENKIKYLILSNIFCIFGLLTHELLVPFLPLLFIQPLLQSSQVRKSLRAWLISTGPQTILTLLYVAFNIYLRNHRAFAYGGTEILFDFKKNFIAFRNQLYSALPLSYYLYQPIRWITVRNIGRESFFAMTSALSGMFLFYVGLRLQESKNIKKSLNKQQTSYIFLILLALALMFVPAGVVSFSARWQDWVKPGIGYLPVYLSYFGWATLASLLISWGIQTIYSLKPLHKFRFIILPTLTFGLGILLFINHSTNQLIAERMDQYYRNPRDLVEEAYENGLLKDVKDNALFLARVGFIWNNPVLSPKTLRKVRNVVDFDAFSKMTPGELKGPLYYMNFATSTKETDYKGWVFLSEFIPMDTCSSQVTLSTSPPEKCFGRLKSPRSPKSIFPEDSIWPNPVLYLQTRKDTLTEIDISCVSEKRTSTIYSSKLEGHNNGQILIYIPKFQCHQDHMKFNIKYTRFD